MLGINEDSLKIGILYLEDAFGLPNGSLPPEMFHFLRIVAMGAKKYELNGWLKTDGAKTDEKSMHDSMFHHLAESYTAKALADGAGVRVSVMDLDHESGESALLHLQCRAGMQYTRRQRDIINPIDQGAK